MDIHSFQKKIESDLENLQKKIELDLAKINNNVIDILVSNAQMKQKLDDIHSQKRELREMVEIHHKKLFGNGQIGMVTQLDRVEKLPIRIETAESKIHIIEKTMAKYLGAVLVVGIVAQFLVSIFVKVVFKG